MSTVESSKAIIIAAHGSRRPESNADVQRLAEALRQRTGARFHAVRHAFLELGSPSIEACIDACVEAGALEVVVIPFFLSPGRHVVEDVPAIVARRQLEHPHAKIVVTDHIGSASVIEELLLSLVP